MVNFLITESRLLLSKQSLRMVIEELLDDPVHHYSAAKHQDLVDISAVVPGNSCWVTHML